MNHSATMNVKRNMAIALSAQGVVLVIGMLKSLLLPHAMEVEGFAYWQQYLLYSGFVGVFALGFNDGVYLLYGDKDYAELPFARLRMAFRLYCGMLLFFSAVVVAYALSLPDAGRAFAFAFVGVDILVACIIGLFTYVLQITNQFMWYSICTLVDKVVFIGLAVALVMMGYHEFRIFVVLDVVCRCISLGLICWRCHEMILGKAAPMSGGVREFAGDVRVGINLMFANFSSMLVTNLGRFIVDLFGGLAGYAFYSFGMSLTNLVLTFVTAASTVLYPALKRVNAENLARHFCKIDKAVLVVGGLGLCMYFPVYAAVTMFYQKYSAVLVYLDVLFVAAFFQAKMTLLVNTFYKTLRMEKRLLVVNIQCVVAFAALAAVSFGITRSVWWIAASTALTAGARCVWSEVELSRCLKVRILSVLISQGAMIAGFFLCSTWGASLATGVAFTVIFPVCSAIAWRNEKQREGVNS